MAVRAVVAERDRIPVRVEFVLGPVSDGLVPSVQAVRGVFGRGVVAIVHEVAPEESPDAWKRRPSTVIVDPPREETEVDSGERDHEQDEEQDPDAEEERCDRLEQGDEHTTEDRAHDHRESHVGEDAHREKSTRPRIGALP
jgi:hypothetical protein